MGAEQSAAIDDGGLDAVFAEQFDRVGFLASLGDTEFFTVEAGSTLFVDDRAVDPVSVSDAAAAAITAAGGHLAAVRLLVDRSGSPSGAAFALLRAALEASAGAIWLLEPDDRTERLTRALRSRWRDIRESEAMSAALGGAQPREDESAWALGHRRWFVGLDAATARMPVVAADVVASAAEVVAAFTEIPQAAEVIASGWAGFGSVAIARHPVRGEMLAGSLSMVLDVAETAISLFHARAVAASSLPDDAAALAHLERG